MPGYKAPQRDMEFVLYELLELDRYNNLPAFAETSRELVSAILEEGGKLAEEVLLPLNQTGDAQGCTFKNGEVRTPAGFKDAYRIFSENGWGGLTAAPEFGGQGLPKVLGAAFSEMCASANMAFAMYPGLTNSAVHTIDTHGSAAQKQMYIPPMAAGRWSGTMNLTEAHCGTDLGLLRSRADPQPDGSYKISGTKIFISGGEHDLTENIIHLVLAKIPGGPEGTRGISLFIVPKFIVDATGELGPRNGVNCGSIEDKMGIHANATCVMNYDGATGYLLGQEHGGMRAMFTMMNEARLGVGVQGLALSEVAYQNAANYARERVQGRAVGTPGAAKTAQPIIVHPDVRRMLLTARAFNEGGRALAYWLQLSVDLAADHPEPDQRTRFADRVDLLTPVMKGYGTDMAFACANMCLQVFGGHGYIRESGMEQFVRDARITQIYEGANGIQGLDLVGRKLPAHGGRAIQAFFAELQDYCTTHAANSDMAAFTQPLAASAASLQDATAWLLENAMTKPENGAAGATDYMALMGLVTFGYLWARMAEIALQRLAEGAEDADFYENKLKLARFFMTRILPDAGAHGVKINSGAEPLMAMDADAF